MAGRDRSRTPRGAASNTDEILSLIVQREQARQGSDFTQADQIREQLTAMGVTLLDKSHQWRAADGRLGKIPSWSDIESGAWAPPGGPAVAEGNDPHAHVKGLVHQREQARANKDFGRGDQLREELKGLGVELFDKEKLWRGKDGSSGVIVGFQTGGGGPTDLEINTLINQREKARQHSDFSTADMIRDELKQYGVTIHDKEKSWNSVDGRAGAVPLFGGSFPPQGVPMHNPVPMPPPAHYGGVPLAVQQQIMNLALQASQDPNMAQRALTSLRQAVQGGGGGHAPVPVAPRAVQAITPRVRTPDRRPVAPLPVMRGKGGAPQPAEVGEALAFCSQAAHRGVSEEEIAWLVEVRERQRKNGDFAAADALRDGMKQCGVELHQKEQRWAHADGRSGEIPTWQALGM